MKIIKLFLLSLLPGILLSIGWPAGGFALILLVALIPLLFVEEQITNSKKNKKRYVFLYSYISFLTWNLLTTWWIVNSTIVGAILAISLNSMFMAIVFLLFHITKKRAGNGIGYLSLIAYWLAFEYLHMNWELSWSWLNLGNGFANFPQLIQWYEFTGTLGGTLWILIINIFIFITLKGKWKSEERRGEMDLKFKICFLITVCLILIPILYSVYRYKSYEEKGREINIVVVQPNIDPYNEKFGGLPLDEQIDKMLTLADKSVDNKTSLLVFPETAISQDVCENHLNEEPSIITLKNYISKYPHLNILIGMASYRVYAENEEISSTARKFTHDVGMYDEYNTALFLDSTCHIQLYHKSKLVPGVERIPYPGILKPFEKFALNLGGTTGSLGTQKDRTPFKTTDHRPQTTDLIIAPAICYESIYGKFISEYIKNGATLLTIITNDGWWGNTPGYKQHFQYAQLRAVETRRSIARSANTGISGFINQRGDILISTQWWKPLSIKQNLKLNNSITFYVKYGDYLGMLGLVISSLILLLIIFKPISEKRKMKRDILTNELNEHTNSGESRNN